MTRRHKEGSIGIMTDTSNNSINIDPNAVMENLLEHIKTLTAENATLRVALNQAIAEAHALANAPEPVEEAPAKESKSSK